MSQDEQSGNRTRRGERSPEAGKDDLPEHDLSTPATGYPPDFNDQFTRSGKKAPTPADRKARRAAAAE